MWWASRCHATVCSVTLSTQPPAWRATPSPAGSTSVARSSREYSTVSNVAQSRDLPLSSHTRRWTIVDVVPQVEGALTNLTYFSSVTRVTVEPVLKPLLYFFLFLISFSCPSLSEKLTKCTSLINIGPKGASLTDLLVCLQPAREQGIPDEEKGTH